MIFQHTYQWVLNGTKTETTRLKKPGGHSYIDPTDLQDKFGHLPSVEMYYSEEHSAVVLKAPAWMLKTYTSISLVKRNGRTLWQVGKTYAVQPGRGKKAVGHVLLKSIREEHVQDKTDKDAIAEGILNWDKYNFEMAPRDAFGKFWDTIHTKRGDRFGDNPEVYTLEFELVEEG